MNEKHIQQVLEIEKQAQEIQEKARREAQEIPAKAEQEAQAILAKAVADAHEDGHQARVGISQPRLPACPQRRT